MENKLWYVTIPGALLFFAGIFILLIILIKVLWTWTVLDLFPGAVEQNLITRSISWYTSFKITIFTNIIVFFICLLKRNVS